MTPAELRARVVEAVARELCWLDQLGSLNGRRPGASDAFFIDFNWHRYSHKASATLAAILPAAGLTAEEAVESAIILTPYGAEDTPGQTCDRRAAALLRALAEPAP